MTHLLLIAVLFLSSAWVDTDAPVTLDRGATEAVSAAPAPVDSPALAADPDDLIGAWELVEQRGYGPDHPDDVEQTLTFHDDGRMINRQSTGDQSTVMVLTYRVEGDQIMATVESVEINGDVLAMDGAMPEQNFQWQIEDGQLMITDDRQATQDLYRKAD